MSSYDLSYDGAELGKPNPILRVDQLSKRFGGLVVTDDVSFEVETGSITGMIGPNGAGKSTLFNLISGFYQPDDGTITVGDAEITGLGPHQIVQRGLVRTFQTPRPLEGMTVREAMMVGPKHQQGESLLSLWLSGSAVEREERENLDRVMELLDLFEMDHLAAEETTNLSGGQMKLLSLARALMTDPEILLLDEPVAGINPTLITSIGDLIQRLNDEFGITFLIIEHNIDFLMDLADPVIVLNQGRILLEGSPDEVRTDQRVMDAYLGDM